MSTKATSLPTVHSVDSDAKHVRLVCRKREKKYIRVNIRVSGAACLRGEDVKPDALRRQTLSSAVSHALTLTDNCIMAAVILERCHWRRCEHLRRLVQRDDSASFFFRGARMFLSSLKNHLIFTEVR